MEMESNMNTEAGKDENPFHITFSFKNPLKQKLLSPSSIVLERVLLFHQLDRLYKEIRRVRGKDDFLETFLKLMNISYDISDEDLARIPKTGPVIVVSNHPYGTLEAVIMCVLLRRVRPDSKVLANFFLSRIPEVRDYCIFVDPFHGSNSKARNIGPIREAIRHLKTGGMLGVFPAGEVAHIDLRKRSIEEPAWNTDISRLLRSAKAQAVPMFISGHNGPLFHVIGLLHPRLRTAMLPHELLNKKNMRIKLQIGQPIPPEKLSMCASDQEVMEYLRFRTFMLENRDKPPGLAEKRLLRQRRKPRQRDVAPPEDPALMRAEVERLPPDQLLVENNEFAVYYGHAHQMSHVLYEIGRLREIAFRLEQEGTGKSIDLDRFDRHYIHLFVWHKENREIVGAYRLAQTDEVLTRFGKRGLYTATLFKYKKALLKQISPALEMGRSFVRPEYQKNYASLLLLWRGIGRYIGKYPKYRNLFGPVSISNEYRSVSRRLLAEFLQHNAYNSSLAKLIKARKPVRKRQLKGCPQTVFNTAVTDVETISSVISDIEGKGKGIPVLLRQYMRLGGKLMGFNMDPKFGNVMDGLILVDLFQMGERQLLQFLGKDGYEALCRYHGKKSSSA